MGNTPIANTPCAHIGQFNRASPLYHALREHTLAEVADGMVFAFAKNEIRRFGTVFSSLGCHFVGS
jgi:hypothetical protein